MLNDPEVHVKTITWQGTNSKAMIFKNMNLIKSDLEHPSKLEESSLLCFPLLH